MIPSQPIGFLNTGVPLLLLGAFAVVLPRVLVPAHIRTHGRVALGIVTAAVLLLMAGAGAIALVYGWQGIGVSAAFVQAPGETAGFFLRKGALAALIWGPILAYAWLSLSQRVEQRRSEDGARHTTTKERRS
ncbi:hypothetical protein VK792_08535 [Mesobacterium sp. TK19101]|uniref:Uncharacterized protein n=1 Tax=Mesobacterium hydrothermale TaxID=3111907 RepID=A0ABU6HFU9_9RHOB|nr:hypothetical protein [Mesobacterium sp. TK19101]MEC3861329.1 hypothetical protein [Mesobacterium sp. TK19101]